MSVLPIVTYDDEVLHKEAEPVKEKTPEIQQLIDDMFDTMYNSDGVGLAAPQIGELLRIFVADAGPLTEEEGGSKYGPLVLINPEITFESEEKVDMEEGCLSIPGVNASVTRPEKIVVHYLDRDFNEQELEIGGWLSRVIQHETDHLDGILFLDYLSMFKRKLLSSKLKDIAKGRTEIDYPIVPKKQETK
ncbi:peptide deformylase [Aliifodinibius salipaludis]|uniref:Peptide deformylase n=1 Tax=Fodinibius salipaludis TaxID=2032627 RepID=A0A2A2GA20_9BACT|nr:peptide deformylase [Aliifodinibius salipaludis]PAU93685.1 peptide deformylase [Aliifodinibius salipaludis]